MPGLINWGAPSTPTDPSQLSGSRINWGSALTSQRKANAVIDAQTRRVQQSQQQEQQQLQQQQQQPKPSFISKTLNFAKSVGQGIIHGPAPIQPTDSTAMKVLKGAENIVAQPVQPIINATKSTINVAKAGVDVASGNQPAARSALNAAKQNVNDTLDTARQFTTRPAVQLATSLEGKQVTTRPTNTLSRAVIGPTPVENIEKGVVSTYQAHPTLPGPARVGLAAAYGAGQLAQDLPVATVAAKGVKAGVEAATAAAGKDAVLNNFLKTTKNNQVLAETAKTGSAGKGAIQSVKQTGTVGEAAVADARTTKIPVSDVPTAPSVGTPALIDAPTYSKLSNQLSKAYDQESAGLKDKGPVVQQKAQAEIDAKYQDLQDKLDASAGKTTVAFGEPKAPAAQPLADKTTVTPAAPRADTPAAVPEATASVPAVQPAETVKVPQEQLPMGTGTEKTSRFAARMQGDLNNLTDEEKAAIPTYKTLNTKENIDAAAMFVDKHPDDVMPILLGEKAPPPGIHHTSIYLAAKAKANLENPDLARNLTSLAATRHGQEISLLREANPNDPISHMSDLRNTRIEAKGGEAKVRARATAEVKAIRAATPKVTKDSWSSFVESLRCP